MCSFQGCSSVVPPYKILKAWQERKISLVISPEIFMEYRRVSEILVAEHSGIDLPTDTGIINFTCGVFFNTCFASANQ